MRYLRAYIAAALLCAVSFCVADARSGEVARLPSDAAPVSYDLRVHPDVKTWSTSGEETVVVRLSAPADHLALNWRGTSLADAQIDGAPATIDVHSKVQQVWFRSPYTLRGGLHRLHLRFTSDILGWNGKGGQVSQDGFLQTAPNAKEPFLVTEFEPSTARRFFPCFDEPQFRASITLHVTAPPGWTVVSNMRGTATPQGDNTSWDFAPTPAMPVYLLTLDAGLMSSIAGKSDGIPLRVFASQRYAAKGQAVMRRVLRDAAASLHFYNAYFRVRYPLPKLDLVIAPFGAYSALEQWGAITIYSPQVIEGGSEDPQRSALEGTETVAHEIAHQWFGDLVGMRWWNDIFVAEGLAEFAQERADPDVYPLQSWWIDDDWFANSVMAQGISQQTRAAGDLRISTDYNSDDWTAFSNAAYYKFADVTRMWELYIGEPAFRRGLTSYLRSNAGRAVGTDDFWNSFHNPHAIGYANAWLRQPGFPIVTVDSHCTRGHVALTFSQVPFTNGKGAPSGYERQLWPVPIFVTANGATTPLLLRGRSMRALLGRCGETFVVDAGLRPYYRLRYVGSAFASHARALSAEDARDQTNAVRDALQLFKARDVRAGYLLDVLAHAPVSDPFLQHDVGLALAELLDQAPRGAGRDAVAQLVRRLAEPVAKAQLGTHDRSSIAWPMTEALMDAGDPKLAPEAWRYLQTFPDGKIEWTDTSWAFAALAAGSADSSTVAQMEKQTQLSASPYAGFPVQLTYLGHVTKPDLVRDILQHYDGEPHLVFALAQSNPRLIWDYLQQHSRQVLRRVPPSQQGWTLAGGVASTMWDVVPPTQMRRFLERSLGPGYRADIDAALADAGRRREAGSALAAQLDRWRHI